MYNTNSKIKIRRIDQDDIRNHCKKYSRRVRNSTVSDVHSSNQFTGFYRSQRASLQIKILKQKIFTRKQRKKQNITTNEDSLKILAVYQKIKFFYNKLALMYKTNESKLTSLLVRHIKVEYYIFSKEILGIIRNFRLQKENESICYHTQPCKIIHELNKFRQFLQSFYEKKCMKQIEIIQSNILQRQEAIRYNTPLQRYQRITKSFRPSLISNNIDISQQFKQMSNENGSFKELSKVQNSLFKKLRQTECKIGKIFQSVCTSKQKDHFLLCEQSV